MAQRVSDYVAQLQKNGYSNKVIRSQLERAGYSAASISAAFAGNNKHFFSKYALFGFLFAVIVLSVVLFFLLFGSEDEVSVKVYAPSFVNFKPGELISFDKVISSSSKTKVSVTYSINSNSGARLSEKSESLLISGSSRTKSRMPVPSNPGSYVLQVAVSLNGDIKSDSFSFVVGGQAVTTTNLSSNISVESPVSIKSDDAANGCAQPCVSSDSCLKSVCKKGVCVFEGVSPCCGNNVCEPGEDSGSCSLDCAGQKSPKESVIAVAQLEASKNIDNALLLCKSLIDEYSVDECIELISQRAKNSGLCTSLSNVEFRDTCFMRFALESDFSVCDKISDRYMFNSCNYLAKANTAGRQAAAA